MDARWDKNTLRLDGGRVLEVYRKTTGWALRLTERGETVRSSWPFEGSTRAKRRAEQMAQDLGWLSASGA